MSASAARPEMVVRLEALISGIAFESAATAASLASMRSRSSVYLWQRMMA